MLAEFEEKSYEAPLYNQLERANSDVYAPGQVLESALGFDRGLFLAESALWETLGYSDPLLGAALSYYNWPSGYGPRLPQLNLPSFRLNLFLQAKRPHCYKRRPRRLGKSAALAAPHWGFSIDEQQQRLLEVLADKTNGEAHVAYACAAFHSNLALFTHTKNRSIVANSTFPSARSLIGHEAWYYDRPGATGIANPTPEHIEERPLLDRVRELAADSRRIEGGELAWLDSLAGHVFAAANASDAVVDARHFQYFDDLQTLERIAERYQLRRSVHSYAQVRLFAARFELSWLVVTTSS